MKNIGIIGAGTMGRDIAAVFAGTSYHVILIDQIHNQLIEAEKEIGNTMRFAKVINKNRTFCENTLNNILYTTNHEELKNVEVVIECTPEKMDIKKKIYPVISKLCKSNVIFCVNTSCISITKIATLTDRPDQVIGVHFMNPATMIHAAEVIRGYHTSKETLDIMINLLNSVAIETIVIEDAPGFVSNRISHLMMNEAAFIVQEGYASPIDIDNIFRKCYNHKLGPLETADLIGLDTIVDSLNILYQSYQDPKFRVCPLLIKLVDAGLLGKKVGKGFYDYI